MKNIIIVLSICFLSACATEKIVYRDRIVEVPKIVFK